MAFAWLRATARRQSSQVRGSVSTTLGGCSTGMPRPGNTLHRGKRRNADFHAGSGGRCRKDARGEPNRLRPKRPVRATDRFRRATSPRRPTRPAGSLSDRLYLGLPYLRVSKSCETVGLVTPTAMTLMASAVLAVPRDLHTQDEVDDGRSAGGLLATLSSPDETCAMTTEPGETRN